jgi:hypothetical protein
MPGNHVFLLIIYVKYNHLSPLTAKLVISSVRKMSCFAERGIPTDRGPDEVVHLIQLATVIAPSARTMTTAMAG